MKLEITSDGYQYIDASGIPMEQWTGPFLIDGRFYVVSRKDRQLNIWSTPKEEAESPVWTEHDAPGPKADYVCYAVQEGHFIRCRLFNDPGIPHHFEEYIFDASMNLWKREAIEWPRKTS